MSRVTAVNGKLDVTKLLDQGLLKVAAEKKKKEIAKKYEALAEEHYLHTLQQVSKAFQNNSGMSQSISESGPKHVKFVKYSGGSGFVTTAAWQRLTKGHIRRKPKSKQFWHKSGQLAKRVSEALRVSKRDSVTAGNIEVQPSGHKGKVRMRFNLTFKKLREPFDTLVRKSFVTGVAHRTPRVGKVYRNSITRIVWLEDRVTDSLSNRASPPRPFLAKLATALGKDMRTGLRKLK